MIVRVGEWRGNENRVAIGVCAKHDGRLRGVPMLLRMCLILAIVEVVVPSRTPRRSVYGDQGQEVAWEVAWEQFIA
jgi:hypothetical protein